MLFLIIGILMVAVPILAGLLCMAHVDGWGSVIFWFIGMLLSLCWFLPAIYFLSKGLSSMYGI